MGSDILLSPQFKPANSFNPRSRMGSDRPVHPDHASHDRFQSTLPYGERRLALIWWGLAQMFQSTLPYGERRILFVGLELGYRVSIHAPVWGATPAGIQGLCTAGSFNPRSRMGSDTIRISRRKRGGEFQSTLPYGERQISTKYDVMFLGVSIHAPVWGATAITYNFSTIFRDCLCNYNNIIVLIQAY